MAFLKARRFASSVVMVVFSGVPMALSIINSSSISTVKLNPRQLFRSKHDGVNSWRTEMLTKVFGNDSRIDKSNLLNDDMATPLPVYA